MFTLLRSLFIAFALTVTSAAQAMVVGFSESDLIEASQVIVIGTLTRFVQAADPADGETRTFAVIDVTQTLKGEAGKTLLLAVPQPGAPISSSDVFYRVSDRGLWYLRLLNQTGSPIYAADHPQRFVPLIHAAPAIAAVRKMVQP